MNTMHTPGPWTVETVKTSVGICHKVQPMLACIYVDDTSRARRFPPADQQLFNAILISAAPDLLRALEMVMACRGKPLTLEEHEAFVAARDAIAKAKGTFRAPAPVGGP